MAKRQGLELSQLILDRYGARSVNALSICEASQLIDELKQQQQAVEWTHRINPYSFYKLEPYESHESSET